ncbi:hypothetical protein A1Q1_05003 [Trichosporon asahii var. asahii CBS 2479]|uniref:Uncharacterized protein n=1 Tax=Trichosporon asahii var. asahii (strain ATCC 90039 / CBS 2479 / JCM 2466 / KCTC 7840 / NBRC 103889/ NCYC 2677 / UAMH 7654) TaxID=1186058 RepID=J5SLV9_TRIAS|nr:hypothetical protein A1Q1_05003 [Trichosporon asahii var. asahii CBS 2479]EJT46356.1 hypothetical protein A1Q1_05003 [Trichosporon asahii var. asahii CBS 2479]
MLNQTRRPRPPGSRRSSAAHTTTLRTPAAEAPSLPTKRYTPRSRAIPGVTTAASLIEPEDTPSRSRARPSSLLSDSSLPSPPPPYRGLPPLFAIPPPPQVLESGPSSVRSSMLEGEEHEADWVDEEAAQSTLTLQGLRRLIAEQEREEENGLDPLVAALGRLESGSLRHNRSPAAAMPGMIDLGSSQPSPPISRRSTVRAFTAPTPKPRIISNGELRQSLARAEAQADDDEARIAALEAALAEARESEDAQRKAAARLRRDLSTVKRQLQYAEDIAAEQKTLPQAPRFRVASRNSTPVLARKLQRRQKRLSADERLGWGVSSFPEFPSRLQESDTSVVSQDEVSQVLGETLDQLSELDSCKHERSLVMEVNDAEKSDSKSDIKSESDTNQATLRGKPPMLSDADAEPEAAQDGPLPRITSGEEASESSPDSADEYSAKKRSGTPGKLGVERHRVRPALKSSTFLTPAKSPRHPFTPVRQVMGSSDYSSPFGGSTGSNKSLKSASQRQFIRRHSPVKRGGSTRRLYEHQRSPSYASTSSAGYGVGRYGTISRLNHARNDSVRSIASDFLNLNEQRTLDAELGSNFNISPATYDIPRMPDSSLQEDSLLLKSLQPSPMRSDAGRGATSGSLTPLHGKAHATSSSLFTPSGSMRIVSSSSTASPAKFVLAGKLAAPEDSDPYDTFSDGYTRRMRLRWSKNLEESRSPEKSLAAEVDQSLGTPWEGDATADESRLAVPTLEFSAPTPSDTLSSLDMSVMVQDPWDEYSDRATPSPRGRNLKPLILCNRPEHARRSSLAMKRLSAAANGNSIAVAAAERSERSGRSERERAQSKHASAVVKDATSIPGRVMHDFICWMLILLDYIEWAIILLYRLAVDVAAGPERRRPRAKRYYL